MPFLPVDSAMSCSAHAPKPTFSVPASTSTSLSRSGLVPADRRAQAQRGVALVVGGEQVGDGVGVVEQGADVGAGEAGGHEAEGGQRGVAPAHVGVGVDDPEAGGAGLAVERAARVGDDDDPARWRRCRPR